MEGTPFSGIGFTYVRAFTPSVGAGFPEHSLDVGGIPGTHGEQFNEKDDGCKDGVRRSPDGNYPQPEGYASIENSGSAARTKKHKFRHKNAQDQDYSGKFQFAG